MAMMLTAEDPIEGVDRGRIAGIVLDDASTARCNANLRGWVRELNSRLDAGYASISGGGSPGISGWQPTAVVVGGWTTSRLCCGSDKSPVPSRGGIATATSSWVCSDCLEPNAPTIWASMPLTPDVDAAGAVSWKLPDVEEAAAAARTGWERWLGWVHEWAQADVRTEAAHIGALLAAEPADVENCRRLVSSLEDLMEGWPAKPETAAAAAWGDRSLQIGYLRPTPSGEDSTRFDTEFVPVEEIAVTPASATRLWPAACVERLGPLAKVAEVVRMWQSEAGSPVPTWLIPTDAGQLEELHAELAARQAGRRAAARSVEL